MEPTINIEAPNGKLIGKAVLLEDGFYHFDPNREGGFWDEYSLRYVADKLEELNEPYRKHIEEYFKSEENGRPTCEF